MASRLDRLFVLLDSGSSSVTRKAAAVQLGEVQKLHPHELNNLLAQLHQYICKPSWETRIAAGQAVEAIAKNVPIWNPQDVALKEENRDNLNKEKTVSQTGRMKFSLFDIDKVLNSGSFLVGSEGKEYEHDNEMTGSAAAGGLDPKEQLASQRQLLNKKLGLDVAQKIGIDTSDIFTNDDLQVYSPSQDNKDAQRKLKAAQKKAVAELVESQMSQISGLSSREMNRAKRKARLVAKQKSKETLNNKDNGSSSNPEGEPVAKKVKSVLVNQPSTDDSLVVDNVIDRSAPLWEENTCWPFESFCDQLCQDLFSPSWETRHGAATALREVIKIHGGGAGKSLDIPADQLEEVNQLWLEDVALRLLCVMALDRFGDFISDQVVAPVRETCAQVLGFVFNLMWKSSVQDVLSIVLQLLNRPEWEVRHGGLLAMKYLLAVRKDMTSDLLPSTFVHIYQGLSDPMDDVVAVAASALVPVSDCLIEVLPDEVMNIIDCLWDSLLEIDDLCASTSSIMALLTSLLSHPSQSSMKTTKPWNELVPRLWPFMNHTSTAVRKCVLKTLLILTKPEISLNYQTWIPIIIQDFMRHLYQRCILEHDPSILHVLFEVWRQLLLGSSLQSILTSACPFLSSWLCLMMQPAQIPIDSNSLLQASHKAKSRRSIGADEELISENKHYIGGESSLHDSLIEKEESVVRCRCMAARFLGLLSCYIKQPMPGIVYTSDMESPIDCYSKLITFHLNSRSALQRFCISLVVKEWAIADKSFVFPEAIKNRLLEALSECIYYDEIAVSFTTCQQECLNFISTMRHYQLSIDDAFQCGSVLTLEQALHLSQTVSLHLINDMKNKPKVKERLEERRKSILHTVQMTNKEFQHLNIKVQASLASAVVHIGCLPPKLNPVIRPIMEAIKKEVVCQLQRNAGRTLTLLLELCLTREPCPNAKILNNLSTFLCSHSAATPNISMNRKNDLTNGKDDLFNGVSPVNDDYDGIITLLNLQKEAEKTALKRSTSVTSKKSQAAITDENSEEKNTEIQKKGAEIALSELCQHFGINLPKKLPKLWEIIFNPIDAYMNAVSSDTNFNKFRDQITSAQELVFSLQVLEIVGYSVHDDLKVFLESHLPHLSMCLRHPYNAVRYMASQVFGMFSKVLCMQTMKVILDQVVPLLSCSEIESRQGACETLACVINHLGVKISPYIVLLILPSLGRMSDQNPAVRTMATHCFGTLIRLMPLEGGLKAELPELSEDLIERREKERKFLDQLLNTNKLESFQMPVPINAKLRTYQQDGVNWLWFLNQYKLHGILCDDMGLGKTIQSICILAGDHHYKKKAAEENPQLGPLSPSLVVCPPTLTGHWVYEVDKFISTEYLNPLHYAGSPAERERLQKRAKHHNLIIASYDIVRNDFDFFGRVKWNYCILDEGHIIKNGKTKLAKAIKQLTANHRLVLSGTPIQNSVLELWSLFDFLMPGFLGTEKQFQAQYSKPILLSRDAKSSSREQEAGAMAMESLHRQVLPFLLRRMKEDVLKDLPPKIIQDYCCELSPLQQQLYEDFEKTKAKRSVEETLSHEEEKVNEHEATHIFQALQYLRKVCNHPKLVLTKLHPQFDKIMDQINHQGSVLTDISHAAKLPALKQLLLDCGIGQIGNGNNSAQTQEPVVNQHRALIFCQLKSMLDIVERDLLKTHMPSVTYLRLDGSVPAGQRHSVVHRFNSDPSIDLLLLTTQVGGVGLNLTGADTVIFVEHDWNPMRDLQAMDRAHRIGQKKVVNVYRLITKGTLEEKIMSLQQFKLSVANTVISEDNSSLQTMGTDNLLDLFSLDESKSKDHLTRRDSVNPRESNAVKNIIDNLPDLWEESQYEDEYDLSHFMRGLVKK